VNRTHRARTLADLKHDGRDPFAVFRLDEALAIDSAWLSRVLEGGPVLFWDDEEDDVPTDPESPPYELSEGVAVLDVEGPLVQRGWWCFEGYDTIARDLEMAIADSRVRAVMLRLNSPGGHAAGCFEASRRMRAMLDAAKKPCVAYADEMAYSAAYALACVADEIVLPEPGGVGSVGVIASMKSVAKMLAENGVDVRVLTSGKEKADGYPELPLDDAAVARAQARVEGLAQLFASWVGDRRKMTPAAVRALEAGVRYGQSAVASGLADRVESYHDTLAALQRRVAIKTPMPAMPGARTRAAATPATSSTRKTMDNEQLLAAVAAMTSKTDPAEQLGALQALKARADQADAAVAEAQGLRTAIEQRDRAQLVAEGRASGKLTLAMEAWANGQPLAALKSYLEVAPVLVPRGEVKAPELPPDVRHAELAAKGWANLSDADKHTLYTQNRPLYDRLRAASSDR
jgi:ClpP class serine protease